MLNRFFFLNDGGREVDNLDTPLNNYDIIGVPTGQWSSHFFACYENIIPSCIVSFFCPCIMWGQIVVRAQIPLFVSVKNSCGGCLRRQTGYGCFVDYFFWSLAASIFLVVLVNVVAMPTVVIYLLSILLIIVFGIFAFSIGHTRTAFREKYLLPGWFPGCLFWDMVMDVVMGIFCMPCLLSQMARHVFQYDRMDPKLGMFFGDPSLLPPLPPTDEEIANSGGEFQRPRRADRAGLYWLERGHHPDLRDNSGRAHRQEEILRQQQQPQSQIVRTPAYTANNSTSANTNAANTSNTQPQYQYAGGNAAVTTQPIMASAVVATPVADIYRADGTKIN